MHLSFWVWRLKWNCWWHSKRIWHKRKLRKILVCKKQKVRRKLFYFLLYLHGIANEMHKMFLCLCRKISHQALSITCRLGGFVWRTFHTNFKLVVFRRSLFVNIKETNYDNRLLTSFARISYSYTHEKNSHCLKHNHRISNFEPMGC